MSDGGKGNRKKGRCKNSAYQMRYTAERRWEKNKRLRIQADKRRQTRAAARRTARIKAGKPVRKLRTKSA